MGDFAKEFFAYLRAKKKMWLLPVILALLLIGGLLVLAQGSAIAPFIYTIF
ncbi:MAG: DUF5989 family protein [Alphaproteobacteria bacterium]